MSWFGDRQKRRFSVRDDPELAAQFWVVFRATLARVQAAGSPPLAVDALRRIEDLLEPSRQPSWDDAYEIEQLFVLVYPDASLRAEFDARLVEASPVLANAQLEYYRWKAQNLEKPDELRQLLATLISSIQWSNRVDEARRWWARRATNLFVGVTIIFGVVLAVITRLASHEAIEVGSVLVIGVAAAAGGWGATLSMVSDLKSRLESIQLRDLQMISAPTILLSRALIGVGAGFVLYLFLTGGLLAGNVFPQLDPKAGIGLRDFALLVIWAVIAGFSEHFVPDLLARTAAQSRSDQESPPMK
jgi:hypothetical protein